MIDLASLSASFRAFGVACHAPSTKAKIVPGLTRYSAMIPSEASESAVTSASGKCCCTIWMAVALSETVTRKRPSSAGPPLGFGLDVMMFQPFAIPPI